MQRADSLEKTLMLGKIEGRRRNSTRLGRREGREAIFRKGGRQVKMEMSAEG